MYYNIMISYDKMDDNYEGRPNYNSTSLSHIMHLYELN